MAIIHIGEIPEVNPEAPHLEETGMCHMGDMTVCVMQNDGPALPRHDEALSS